MLPFLCGQENLSTSKDLCDYIGLTCIIQDQSPHHKALNLEYFHLLKVLLCFTKRLMAPRHDTDITWDDKELNSISME